MQLDRLSPAYLGEDKIAVQLADPSSKPTVGKTVRLDFGYDACAPAGVVLPVEVVVQSPKAEGFESKVFRHSAPGAYAFTPIAAGPHLVLVRELFHNRWQGRLVFDVEGDAFDRDPNVRI